MIPSVEDEAQIRCIFCVATFECYAWCTVAEDVAVVQVTIAEFEERIGSLRKTSDSLQEQVRSPTLLAVYFCLGAEAGAETAPVTQ